MLVLKPSKELDIKGPEYCLHKCLKGYSIVAWTHVWTPLRELTIHDPARKLVNRAHLDFYFYSKTRDNFAKLFLFKLRLPEKVVERQVNETTRILQPQRIDIQTVIYDMIDVYREIDKKVDELYIKLNSIPRKKRRERARVRGEIASYEILLEIIDNILVDKSSPSNNIVVQGQTIWAPIILALVEEEQEVGGQRIRVEIPMICQAYGKPRIDKAYTYAAQTDDELKKNISDLINRNDSLTQPLIG